MAHKHNVSHSHDMHDDVIIPPAPPDKKELRRSLLELDHSINETHAKLERSSNKPHEVVKETTTKETTVHEDDNWSFMHKMLKATCVVALVIWFVSVLILSVVTQSMPFSVLVGLSPLLFTIIVTYILIDQYHMRSGFLMVFPFIFTGILLLIGVGGLLPGIDYANLAVVNVVLGLLFEAVVTMHHGVLDKKLSETTIHKEEKIEETVIHSNKDAEAAKKELKEVKKELAHVKKLMVKLDSEEDVKKFIASIEDKAKAINAVIGRVYSVRRGGTESMRKKIRIDAEHYNEFNELKDKAPNKRKAAAISLLKKIDTTLSALERPETDMFTSTEMSSLVRLNRDAKGRDPIIQILIRNDSDPVKIYFDGAKEFCRDALKALE